MSCIYDTVTVCRRSIENRQLDGMPEIGAPDPAIEPFGILIDVKIWR